MDLFVYYDVPHEQADATRRALVALRIELGCAARLMRRPEPGERATTWMEVYADVAPDFEARLAAAAAGCGLAALTGPRHVERFVELDERFC